VLASLLSSEVPYHVPPLCCSLKSGDMRSQVDTLSPDGLRERLEALVISNDLLRQELDAMRQVSTGPHNPPLASQSVILRVF
jgi:hypothetical protein